MKIGKDKIIISKKEDMGIMVIVGSMGVMLGWVLNDLFDGWMFWLSVFLSLLFVWILLKKILPPIYVENKKK